jgi:formiminotetrahydrofolate cyclodeaminase
MAAALTIKAVRLSTQRIASAEEHEQAVMVLRDRAMDLSERDAELYAEVIQARRSQRSTTDPTTSVLSVTEALERANQVPQELVEIAGSIGRIAGDLAETGNPNLVGDCITAQLLADAAARAAIELIEINSPHSASSAK